jgi:hypothetical protein
MVFVLLIRFIELSQDITTNKAYALAVPHVVLPPGSRTVPVPQPLTDQLQQLTVLLITSIENTSPLLCHVDPQKTRLTVCCLVRTTVRGWCTATAPCLMTLSCVYHFLLLFYCYLIELQMGFYRLQWSYNKTQHKNTHITQNDTQRANGIQHTKLHTQYRIHYTQ